MSREELAEAVNEYLWKTTGTRYDLDANSIARYERGKVRWPSRHYREGLREVLGVAADSEIGFWPTRRGKTKPLAQPNSAIGEMSTSVDLSVLAGTYVETPVPTRAGWTDVEHVRAATRVAAMSENRFGGVLSAESAAGQLRWAGRLIEAQATDQVRRAIFEAAGNLASVVAFSAFDFANYGAAERYFQFALWCSGQGESWPLRANTLAEMARMATYLGDLDHALSLIEFAQVRADRVSGTARAMLAVVHARLLALNGRYAEARIAVERADEQFAGRDVAEDPPWLCYYDEAEHQGSTGKALLPGAVETGDLDIAASRLRAAIRLHDQHYPRSRVFSLIRLASLTMSVGDPHEAVSIGRQALDGATRLRSKRIASELHGLARVSRRHSDITDVAELRQDLVASGTDRH
ncbi:tetratricopeptide repeat protein [Tamaricihabitans halophyticus]|nr:tetratricopeptide repeat protein [Tamaricihabitans halophyticus]